MDDNFDFSSFNIDDSTLELLSKIITAMNSLNNEDYRCNLLYAIKPLLDGVRREEVDNCIKILKISTILKNLKEMNKDGDNTTK